MLLTTTDMKPKLNPMNLLKGLLQGKKTKVAIKEDSADIEISIAGIPQHLAIEHIRNLCTALLEET